MAWRLVIGKIYKTNDTPWVNTPVIFRRQVGSYTTNIQYPPDALKFSTNAMGDLISVDTNGGATTGCRLWVNEEGDKISNYECLVGRDRFNFSLPLGDGSPIELSVLRAGSAPVESYPQSIIDYVDDAVAGVTAGNVKKVISDTFVAPVSLSALRIINLNSLQLASASNISDVSIALGFLESAVNLGASFTTVLQGTVSDSAWNWNTSSPIFLGANGILTQNTSGLSFIRQIAAPVSNQKIIINFGESIIL
jgi:hypothetical protein